MQRKAHCLYLYRNFLFSVHHLAIHYQLKNNRAQETNEQHEQEIQRCRARFKAQMVQALLYSTEGHSLGLYTSFIKLHLNWCSHPDSRNHHASFPFKRGNKYCTCKAFCIRGSESPSPALWLIKPPRQTAAYPTDGLQRCKEVKCFAHHGLGSHIARSQIYTSSLEMHLTEPITHVATLNEWDFIASIFQVLSMSS